MKSTTLASSEIKVIADEYISAYVWYCSFHIEYLHRWNSISSKFFACYFSSWLLPFGKICFHKIVKKNMKPKLRLPSHIPFTQQQQKNGRIPDIYMENTCFHRQISICCHKFSLLHVCKTICASFASFFNKPFLFETSKISLFTENHLANTNQKKGKKYVQHFRRSRYFASKIESMLWSRGCERKEWNQMEHLMWSPISEKLCWISFRIVPLHFYFSCAPPRPLQWHG